MGLEVDTGFFFSDRCSLSTLNLIDFYDDVIVILAVIMCLVRLRIYSIFFRGITHRNFTENNFIEVI